MALMTAAEARLYIPTLTGTVEDAHLDTLIARADAAIATLLGYPRGSTGADPTVLAASYTWYGDGYGLEIERLSDDRIRLPAFPLGTITSVHADATLTRTYGSAELVASSDYAVQGQDLVLLSGSTLGVWPSGRYALKVVCSAGYSAAPLALKQACTLTVQHWWQGRREGTRDASPAGVVPQHLAVPVEARQLLTPYRLAGSWVA